MKNATNTNKNIIAESAVPFFSVIITAYNRSDLLIRALGSLISQTEKDWEAIIVDDGSTDDTYDKILPFLESSSNINYIIQPHAGEAIAKNRGIWSAKGLFITFLDSDDEFDPVHLEYRKKALLKNSSVEFLHGGVKVIGNQYVADRFNLKKKINLKHCIIGGTFFIKREVVKALKGFREIPYGTDSDLFDRAKDTSVKIKKIYYPTYIYHRESEDSITNKIASGV